MPALEQSKSSFVIDDCLFDIDPQPDIEGQEGMEAWFRESAKQKPEQEYQIISSQDLKYIMIGMKWGATIF